MDLGNVSSIPGSGSEEPVAKYYYGNTIILESHRGEDPESKQEYSYCDVHFMPLGATSASELKAALFWDPKTQRMDFDDIERARGNFEQMQDGIKKDISALKELFEQDQLPEKLIFTPGGDIEMFIEQMVNGGKQEIPLESSIFEDFIHGGKRRIYLTQTKELATFLELLAKREFDENRQTANVASRIA